METPQPNAEVIQQAPDVNTAPGLDSELDDALSKAFQNVEPEKPNEPQKQEVKTEPKPDQKEVAPEPSRKEGKPNIEDKAALPDPEQINEAPSGKVSQQSKEGWSALRNNYKKAHRLVQEKEQEILKLKSTLAEKGTLTQKETESLKGEIEELNRYRAMVDIQADPQFISTYDQPIESNMNSIKEMLRGLNVSQEIVDQLDFSNTKLMDEIIGHVGQHRDKFVARKLERKVEELVNLIDKRDETLVEQKKNYKEYIESKKKENFSKEAEGEGRMLRHLENIAAGKDAKGEQKHNPVPFLNKITLPETATQAQIDQANNHNKVVDLMNQKVQSAIMAKTPEERAEVAVAAVASHYFAAQLKAATNRIKSLEAEIQKISTVSSETEKGKIHNVKRNGSVKEMDLDQALESHFSSGN